MRRISLRRPSPAMVVACVALVVALGGTSYATVLQVPRASVGPAQLKTNAVTAKKIAPNAVSAAKVRNGSLLKADFAPGQLPAGPTGPQGPAGAPGLSAVERIEASSANNSVTPKVLRDHLSRREETHRWRRAGERRNSESRALGVVPGQRQHLPGESDRNRRVHPQLVADGVRDLRPRELTFGPGWFARVSRVR